MRHDKNPSYSSYAQRVYSSMSFKKARKLAKVPGSCVEIVDDCRTISLPWSFLGHTEEGIEIVLDRMLCSYRNKLAGVPIARGDYEIIDHHPVIVEDQPNFHVPINCKMAVFRPRIGSILPAHVVRIDEGQIVCSIYGFIHANIWRNYGKKKRRSVHLPNVGDEVTLKITRLRLYRRSLQLKAEIS